MPAYRYDPYDPLQAAGSIGDLLGRQNAGRAHAAQVSGAAWGGAIQDAAQMGANLVAGIQKDRAEAPQRAAEAEMDGLKLEEARAGAEARRASRDADATFSRILQSGTQPTPGIVLGLYGPERGAKIMEGLAAFEALETKKTADARGDVGRVAASLTAFGPELQGAMWPQLRAKAADAGIGIELPEAPSEEAIAGVLAWATGQMPAKESEYTLTPGDKRFRGDTEIASVAPPTPATPNPTEASLAAAAAAGDQNAAEALRLMRAQNPPSQPPRADYQWVQRGGQWVEVERGKSQPGDKPATAPVNTGETAQDRQRNARTTAARDFLGRLNELRTKINTRMGPAAGVAGYSRRLGASMGMDPDVAEYERIRAAGGRALAVAIMGAQNLSDADASAWANMLPDARTDEETAGRLTAQVEKMLDGMTGTGAAAPPANADPLGLGF